MRRLLGAVAVVVGAVLFGPGLLSSGPSPTAKTPRQAGGATAAGPDRTVEPWTGADTRSHGNTFLPSVSRVIRLPAG